MVPPRDGISPVAVAGWAVTRVIAEAGECRNTLTPVGEAFRRLLRTVYVVKWLSWKRMPSSGSVISRSSRRYYFLTGGIVLWLFAPARLVEARSSANKINWRS